jgi:hypothetical protein
MLVVLSRQTLLAGIGERWTISAWGPGKQGLLRVRFHWCPFGVYWCNVNLVATLGVATQAG